MDTIIVARDSLVLKFCTVNEECQAGMKEMGINWTDIITVSIICMTVLMIVLYFIYSYFRCKEKSIKHQDSINENQRKYEVIDREWKKKNALEDQLLSHLKPKEGKQENDEYKAKLEEMIGTMSENNKVIK